MLVSPEDRQTVLDEVVREFVRKAKEDRNSTDIMTVIHADRFDESAAVVAALGGSSQVVDEVIDSYLNGIEPWIDYQLLSRALRMARSGKASIEGVTKVLESAIRFGWLNHVLDMTKLLDRPLSKGEFLALVETHMNDLGLNEERGKRLYNMSCDYLSPIERLDLVEKLRQKKKDDDNAISL